MVNRYEYLQEFSPDGTLKMIDHALECITSSIPIVIIKTKNGVFISAKKQNYEKLEIKENKTIIKINNNVYMGITGNRSDIDQLIMNIREIEMNKTYELGYNVSVDILARSIADDNQKYIMKSGIRPLAFSSILFGIVENEYKLYHTDTSSTYYSFHGLGIGRNYIKMNKYLEKNYKEDITDDEAYMIVLNTLGESIGNDYSPDSVIVGMYNKLGMRWLSVDEIDVVLQRISETE